VNVLLLCLDALRYDHVTPEIMPWLDSRAAQGTRWTNVRVATERWTLPSVASILFGDDDAVLRGPKGNVGRPTLAGRLDRTHRTAAFLGNPVFGMWGGMWMFDGFSFVGGTGKTWAPRAVDDLWGAFTVWRSSIVKPKPWFVYLHLIEPHDPYLPGVKMQVPETHPPLTALQREELACGRYSKVQGPADRKVGRLNIPEEAQAYLRQRYTAYCSHLDGKLSELVPQVEGGETIVVVTTDHGESLGENGLWAHGPGSQFHTEEISHAFACAWGPEIETQINDAPATLAMVPAAIVGMLTSGVDLEWNREMAAVEEQLRTLGYIQ